MHSALLRLLLVEDLASELFVRWISSRVSVAVKWSGKWQVVSDYEWLPQNLTFESDALKRHPMCCLIKRKIEKKPNKQKHECSFCSYFFCLLDLVIKNAQAFIIFFYSTKCLSFSQFLILL